MLIPVLSFFKDRRNAKNNRKEKLKPKNVTPLLHKGVYFFSFPEPEPVPAPSRPCRRLPVLLRRGLRRGAGGVLRDGRRHGRALGLGHGGGGGGGRRGGGLQAAAGDHTQGGDGGGGVRVEPDGRGGGREEEAKAVRQAEVV